MLPDLFVRGELIVSIADMVPLTDWLAAHRDEAVLAPVAESERQPSQRRAPATSASKLLQEHPWLRSHLSAPELLVADEVQASSDDEDHADPDVNVEDDNFVASALHHLEERRAQWVVDSNMVSDSFEVIVRGGAWLARERGKAFDEFRAQLRAPQAKLFFAVGTASANVSPRRSLATARP